MRSTALAAIMALSGASSSGSGSGAAGAVGKALRGADGDVERLEPGGWGALLSMARHPIEKTLWVGAFDVGGLAFSTNDAKSWSVGCNPDIHTLQVSPWVSHGCRSHSAAL